VLERAGAPMNIVHDWPPNIDQIDAAFNVRGQRGVIFTWGGTIFVPGGESLSPALRAHEAVHTEQQTTDVRTIQAWWDRYIADTGFRLEQEKAAHRAEYREYCRLHRDRNVRAEMLRKIAQRLCGPLYGKLVSYTEAKKFVEASR
jgi:hypothetical protein